MEIIIKDKKENGLLDRTEVNFEIVYENAPPKRPEIKEALAKALNVNPNLVVVEKIRNVFGMRKSVGYAHVYNKEESLNKYERKHLLKRWAVEKKEEKPEEKTEEQPTEGKKEEAKEGE
ncbi:MAG: 30S ribosomal protein S24e [Candidatus Aenigmarchaeota archaeon]|nr:30S ribosomal protein S24e [Candidatus Aenigmarchaeota archaeon]